MSSRDYSATDWATITPAATPLSRIPVALYISADGDVEAESANGNSATFVGLTAGTILPIQPSIIDTGTTATVIALYNLPA